MLLTTLLRGFFFSLATGSLTMPFTMIFGGVRDFLFDPFHGARHFIADLFDLQIRDQVFDFRRHAVTARNSFAERDGLTNHPQVRATRATEFQICRGFSSALRTEHSVSVTLYAPPSKVVQTPTHVFRGPLLCASVTTLSVKFG